MSLIDEIVRASRENLDKGMTKPGSSEKEAQDITEWLINAAANMYSSTQDRYKEALKEESKRNAEIEEWLKDPKPTGGRVVAGDSNVLFIPMPGMPYIGRYGNGGTVSGEIDQQINTWSDLLGALEDGMRKTTDSPAGFEGKAAVKEVGDSMKKAADELGSALSDFGSWAGGKKDSDTPSKSEEALSEGQGEDKKEESSPSYDVDEMAGEFILGAWGNGQDRIDNMLNAGYTLEDYNKIQQRVNEAYASGRDLHEWTNKANEKLHYW